MLGKLLKHEFIATGRMYIPVYLCVLILTPILGFIIKAIKMIDMEALSIFYGLSMASYVLLLVAASVSSFVFIIIRFYKSMTTDEAYLTFTIPAKTTSIVSSKLIPSILWATLSVLLFIFSIGLFTFILELWDFSDLSHFLNEILENPDKYNSLPMFSYNGYRASFVLFILLFIIMLMASTISGILQVYASISLGQLMKTHRLLASIGFYMALYAVMQVLTSIAIFPFMFHMTSNANNQSLTIEYSDYSGAYFFDPMNATFIISIITSIIMSVVFYIITTYCFHKKLNLE